MFVLKLHHATRLHCDLRILEERRLLSWALPAGPSRTPGLQRLAVRVGDHKPEYALTERRIPKGQYGAGPMIVWDVGFLVHTSVENGEFTPVPRALRNGRLEFWVEGFRLRGGFSLEHTGETDNWALTKLDDEEARHESMTVSEQDPSILSGLTLAEIGRKPNSQLSFAELLDDGPDGPDERHSRAGEAFAVVREVRRNLEAAHGDTPPPLPAGRLREAQAGHSSVSALPPG
jgi:bifunctional non-homologous end joining protein LigD